MGTLLSYIKNIGFFLILVSVICNALPDNSYKKYCRLFCGLILVVLVLNPFNEFLNYDRDIGEIFTNKSYQSKLWELEAGMKIMEEDQLEQALELYENEIKNILQSSAGTEGLEVLDVKLSYTENKESNDFELEWIHIYVTDRFEADKDEYNSDKNISNSSDINLDEIHIDDIEINIDKESDNENSIDKLSPGDRPKALRLIESASKLLGIETYKIKITMR